MFVNAIRVGATAEREEFAMPSTREASPLRPEAGADLDRAITLWLLDDASTPEQLVERLQELAARFDVATAEEALGRLMSLGLVRVASPGEGERTYARTTLGHEYAESVTGSDSPIAAGLAELEQLRTDFVATVAHELKTPLTAIRTCVGLLMDSNARADADVRRRLLEMVATSADGMQHLITNLLDLARHRSGNVQLEARWIDAMDLARDAIALVAPLIEQQGQELRLTGPDGPVEVYVDRRRLVQALANVLSNAHKFSPPGAPIDLTVRQAGDHVAWDVRDHGPGITSADQRHLFERFFRSRSDTAGGSGLGLPIALAAVQAHGGSITVESTLGEGSLFTIRVPAGENPCLQRDES